MFVRRKEELLLVSVTIVQATDIVCTTTRFK